MAAFADRYRRMRKPEVAGPPIFRSFGAGNPVSPFRPTKGGLVRLPGEDAARPLSPRTDARHREADKRDTWSMVPTHEELYGKQYSRLATYRSDLDDEALFDGQMPLVRSSAEHLGRRRYSSLGEGVEEVSTPVLFPFVETTCFQSIVGIVIAFNAVIIGMETDTENHAFWVIEQLLMVFFCVELGLRLVREKEDFLWGRGTEAATRSGI